MSAMQDRTHQPEVTPRRQAAERIEIQVRQVDDLFQPFDPAPMQERRVAVEADAYISERAAELGEAHPLRLTIRLPEGEGHCIEAVQQAFRRHFGQAASKRKSMLRNHFRIAWQKFFIAIVIAVVLVYLSQYIADIAQTALLNKISSGLSIAVWVVLWRPFEMIIHDWHPLDREYRLYRRLEGIEVESIAG
jgi:hypothetical protein